MQKFGVKNIVAIGIGTALFFLLARFASIPVPGIPNTTINFQYAVLGFFAAAFGPITGLIIGLAGHAFTDLAGYGLWWSWIIVSAIVGLLYGFVLKGIKLDEGEFGGKGIIRFVLATVIIMAICWVGAAPALDVLIYAEPYSKVIAQGLAAGISNAITTAIVGSLLLFAYSKTRTKSGSLNKD